MPNNDKITTSKRHNSVYGIISYKNWQKLLLKISTAILMWFKKLNRWSLGENRRGLVLVLSALLGIAFTLSLLLTIFIFEGEGSFSDFIKFIISFDVKNHKINVLEIDNSLKYVFALFIGILPTFVLWRFRNQNKLKDQENTRKDINLKDFQKLQEWATGGDPSSKVSNALQVSAIHQLGAFFRGEFGEQFQVPAYELLFSLWVDQFSPIKRELSKIQDELNGKCLEVVKHRSLLQSKTHNRISYAVIAVVFGDRGITLQNLELSRLEKSPNSHSLIAGRLWFGLNYFGLNYNVRLKLSGLELSKIVFSCAKLEFVDFSYTKLISADLRGADLNNADLTNADLTDAKLMNADLTDAKLLNAKLLNANLTGTCMIRTEMNNSKLMKAFLIDTNFYTSNLNNADLSSAILGRTDISYANLTSVDFSDASLSEVNLAYTELSGAVFLNLKSFESVLLENSKNIDQAIIGYFKSDYFGNINIDRKATNELRNKFGLARMSKSDENKLRQQIQEYLKK
ncbi:MAG: pentapeptide repeat-containing protein [Candidatus Pacebacteria bacterium]|nr:pentapeptide repeat-containing protein [Candidatus Paceibacterota bacterium]